MNKYARDKVNGRITLIYGLSGNGWLQGGNLHTIGIHYDSRVVDIKV